MSYAERKAKGLAKKAGKSGSANTASPVVSLEGFYVDNLTGLNLKVEVAGKVIIIKEVK